MRRLALLVGCAAVVALAAGGCSTGDSSSTDATTTTMPSTTSAPATTTTAPTTTVTSTTSTATTSTVTTTTVPIESIPFPDEVQGVQGESSWGVYVVTSDQPGFETSSVVVIERLLDLGYEWFAFGVSLGCDQGAADALDTTDDVIAVAIYFATEDDAEAFAAAYLAAFGDEVFGIAEVTNYCLD